METSPAPLRPLSMGSPGAALWKVEMNVIGYAWFPLWEGYAENSIDACSRARRDFYGDLHREAAVRQRYPLRIVSCMQVGA